MQIIHPLKDKKARIRSKYGYRTHPITGEIKSFHNGVDYAVPCGTPIYSVIEPYNHEIKFQKNGAGIYIKQWYKTQQGNEILIYYMHLEKGIDLKLSLPKKGDLIGFTGNTGRSTGPHLHFELRMLKAGHYSSIDPLNFIV